MSGWSKATLTQNDLVGPGLHRLTLEVPARGGFGVSRAGTVPPRARCRADSTRASRSPPRLALRVRVPAPRQSTEWRASWPRCRSGAEVRWAWSRGPAFPSTRAKAHEPAGHRHRHRLRAAALGAADDRREPTRTSDEVHGAYGVLTPAHLAFGLELEAWERARHSHHAHRHHAGAWLDRRGGPGAGAAPTDCRWSRARSPFSADRTRW